MPAKKRKLARRVWTASDVRELRSLAKTKAGVAKISNALKRTADATGEGASTGTLAVHARLTGKGSDVAPAIDR